MVNGAKRAKRSGQIQMPNATSNRIGLINHHTSIARRGPKSIKIVTAQHIYIDLYYCLPTMGKFIPNSAIIPRAVSANAIHQVTFFR